MNYLLICSFISQKNASEVGLSKFVDLQELKLSLFYEFETCPYIHPLVCLVVSNNDDLLTTRFVVGDQKKNNWTAPVGYLCEEAELDCLAQFLHVNKLFGNYACFLEELFDIVEAIQFLHEHGIIHDDIHTGNVLLFSDGNQVRMKLIDFGQSKTVGEYEPVGEFSLESIRRCLSKSSPELLELKSFDEMAVFKKDWMRYSHFLADIIKNVWIEKNVEFKEIEKLIPLLRGKEYWKLENILQIIKEYIDREIENCLVKKPFSFKSKINY